MVMNDAIYCVRCKIEEVESERNLLCGECKIAMQSNPVWSSRMRCKVTGKFDEAFFEAAKTLYGDEK